MNIGVVAYINPYEFKDYFEPGVPLPNINGFASAVNTITLGLLKAGHKIIAISSYPEKGPTLHFEGKNISFHLISTYSNIPKMYVFEKYYMVNRLKKEISKHIDQMDVIHTHWTYDFALASSKFANIKPVFCTIRDWAPIIRKFEKRHRKILWWMIQEQICKKVLNNKKIHFIANSPYIKTLMENNYPKDECTTIENPIKKQFILEERKYYPSTPTFISIAQDLLDERKNITNLLYAFKRLHKEKNESKLILIGKYNDKSFLFVKWKEEKLLEGVELKGFIKHDDLINLIDFCSALVHPSLEESFGNTLLEGMARRIPVIGGKKSGAIPYVIGNGKYGLLCDVTNPNDIEKALKTSLKTSELKETIDRATDYLKNNLTEEIVCSKHIALFNIYIK